jgi:hypothetical protein
MQTPVYRYVIEMFTHDGTTSLGQYPVEVDWEPAREHLRLLGLRRGAAFDAERIAIEPVWSEKFGEPHATGARLTAGELVCEVPQSYFKPLAVEASGDLVEKEVLKTGDRFLFQLLAYRQQPEPSAPRRGGFTVRDATPPLAFVDSSLATLQAGAMASGEGEAADVPVFIPQQVLDEAEALTREAGSVETGGILIGRLHRDASIPEIGVVVTAQIPAQHTQSKTTALTFTAETWTAVQAAIDLRKSGQIYLGWWHSHPSFAFCNAECPPERRRVCALQRPFLSADDLVLHRTVFPKAYHVALLANHSDAGIAFSLYGWRAGAVQSRAFHVLGATRPPRAAAAPELSSDTSTGESHHATPCSQ